MSDNTRLGRELAALEAIDPEVAKAARKYDEVVKKIIGTFGDRIGERAYAIFNTTKGKQSKSGERYQVEGAAYVGIVSIKGNQYEVEVILGSGVAKGRKQTFERKDLYVTPEERAYFGKLVLWLWSGEENPGKRPTVLPTTIHLATGIICGGDKLWCGAKMETEYREDTKQLHVLNATQDEDRCNCGDCLVRYAEAQDAVARRT